MAAITYITSQTLGSNASSVSFTNIPQTYTDLYLVCSTRGSRSSVTDMLAFVFNNDSSSVTTYSTTALGNFAGTTAGATSSNDYRHYYAYTSGDNVNSNMFGYTELYIGNYTSTSNRQIGGYSGGVGNSTQLNSAKFSGNYTGTSAITRIDITSYYGNTLMTGSSFYLYGISNA